MSSAINRPFGEVRPRKGRVAGADRSVFLLRVEGDNIKEFIEFLEFVYDSPLQVKERGVTVILFSSHPHRTAAGIRFALSLFGVTLLQLLEW